MNRVISYIDGFNLYFGLRDKGWRKYYWLDMAAMSRALLRTGQNLTHCYYFTARIKADRQGHQSRRNQKVWLDALAARNDIECCFGHYLYKDMRCKICNDTWQQPEEKMTDVNIATQLVVDAYEGNYDMAMVVSGDSDLTPPIKHIRERFPDKRVLVVFPPKRHSMHLINAAHGYMRLSEDKLRKNLLPDEIATDSGFVLKRPDTWR